METKLGYKDDSNKIERYDLIPVKAERYLAILFGCGARKYEERNWEKGLVLQKCIAAVKRHSNLILSGELIDPDDGIPHAAKLMWIGAVLIEFQDTHPELLKPLRKLPRELSYKIPANKMPKQEIELCMKNPKIVITEKSLITRKTWDSLPTMTLQVGSEEENSQFTKSQILHVNTHHQKYEPENNDTKQDWDQQQIKSEVPDIAENL